ncbi:transglycosylase SLT domain-containing protein [bacterium]|nr:transglycosylase SLT domain-containing protein [bacterium]
MSSKFMKSILCVGVAVLIAAVAWGFLKVYSSYNKNLSKIEKLNDRLSTLRAAMNVDSIRQYNMQKIMGIIKKHNSSMPSEKVYDIANEIYKMSLKYSNLNVDLICAVITHESAGKWDPEITSKDGAMGLMQLMPVTCSYLAQAESLPMSSPKKLAFNPIYNIRMGCRLLSLLVERYGVKGGLAAYNGGERMASIWLNNGKEDQYLWKETREYVPAVFNLYTKYQKRGHEFVSSPS